MDDDEDVKEYVLAQLDEIFDGKASDTLLNFTVQNWSREPYIRGSYSHYNDEYRSLVNTLQSSIEGKVYFAGEAMIVGDSSTVHGAGFSGIQAAEEILQS